MRLENRSKICSSKDRNLVKRGRVWYFRVAVDGVDVWRSTKTGDKAVARAKVARMRRDIEREGIEGVKKKKKMATIGEVIASYVLFAAGAALKKATVRNNKAGFLRVVREVHGPGALRMSASILTPALLSSYAGRRIEAAKKDGAAALNRALNTTTSTVNQARSLFAQRVRDAGAYDDLELPDLDRFMRYRLTAGKRIEWTPPTAVAIERLQRLLPLLKARRLPAWRALGLMANVGMRRGEILRARWDQPEELNMLYGSALVMPMGVESKGNPRKVEINRDWWEEMKATRDDLKEPFIIPGATLGERDRVLDYTCALLRVIGIGTTLKPNHDLRRLQASLTADRFGAREAQRTMGHADQRTTADYYLAPLRPGRAVRVL